MRKLLGLMLIVTLLSAPCFSKQTVPKQKESCVIQQSINSVEPCVIHSFEYTSIAYEKSFQVCLPQCRIKKAEGPGNRSNASKLLNDAYMPVIKNEFG